MKKRASAAAAASRKCLGNGGGVSNGSINRRLIGETWRVSKKQYEMAA